MSVANHLLICRHLFNPDSNMPNMATVLVLLLLPFAASSSAASSSTSSAAYPPPYGGDDGGSCGGVAGLEVVRREEYGGGRILDITHRYREDMPVFLSDEGLGQYLWLPHSMKNGSLANNSEMKMPTHTGTHVDAPGHVFQHYYDAGFDVDTLDLDVLNGKIGC